jgi:hypothetical protein
MRYRPRVEAGTEIQHGVDPVGHSLLDEGIDDDGPDHHRPVADKRLRQRGEDFPAVLAGDLPGERIAEQRLRPVGFQTPDARDHEGRIGDILDELLHGGDCSSGLLRENPGGSCR